MGRGIAHVAALGGYATLLQDSSRDQLENATNQVSAILEKGVATGRVSEGDALDARKRLRAVSSLEEAARGADLVIEAVPERIELKLELFAQLDRVAAGARDPGLEHGRRSASPSWRPRPAARRSWWDSTSSIRCTA